MLMPKNVTISAIDSVLYRLYNYKVDIKFVDIKFKEGVGYRKHKIQIHDK